MRLFSLFTLTALLVATGCVRLSQPFNAQPEDLTRSDAGNSLGDSQRTLDADARLAEADRLVRTGQLAAAQEVLAPLLGSEAYTEDAGKMVAEIGRLRAREAETLSPDMSERLALFDVESRLRLPESYSQTVVISQDSDPREMPPGNMETLVRRKISMHLDDATVRDIILALGKIDGLNIIADKALSKSPVANSSEPPQEPTLTIHVDNLELREILSYIARNMGIAFHLSSDVIWVTASDQPPGAGRGPALETRIFRLRHGIVPAFQSAVVPPGDTAESSMEATEDHELRDVLESFLAGSPPGSLFRIYPLRNLLVVRDSRDNLRLVEEFLREFDKEPKQVLIEARFITISQADLLRIGFSLDQLIVPQTGSAAGFGDLAASPLVRSVITTAGNNVTEVTERTESNMSDAYSFRRLEASGAFPGTLTLSGILGNTTYIAVLDALKQIRSSKTLSVPRITVANNHTARIHRGTKRYYFEEYDVATIDEGEGGTATRLVPTGIPREIELGYQLNVKVNVGNNGKTIMLALRPKINDISGYEFFDAAKLPILDENTLETTVVVNSGETVVLGGMITKAATDQEKRVPYLSAIPILGKLFRTRTTEENPHHLLIFVNATVIDSSGRLVDYKDAG
jgi:type IV pilus assembly protein PilQ